MSKFIFQILLGQFFTAALFSISAFAQPEQINKPRQDKNVRPVTIPISIVSKQESRERQADEFVEAGDIIVKEDGDNQIILSIRSVSETPLALAILVQEDLTSFNLELRNLAGFIRTLPRGSRVMVAYLRGGSIQVRQRFTDDLEKAAQSLRIVAGTSSAAPSSPYQAVSEALERFDSQPTGRRAVLLISDGLDGSRGLGVFSTTQSPDLEQSILRAQRKGVAVYSFYTPTRLTDGNSNLALNAQGGLNRLSDETGGRAFFQGTFAPVSFEPFFRRLNTALKRQFALTYLSTHLKKGYHKVAVTSTNPEIEIVHPKGYYYR